MGGSVVRWEIIKFMDNKKVSEHIVKWLSDYCKSSGTQGFVIGISGGIDSALTSKLAAKTGLPTLCVALPIHQSAAQVLRTEEHIACLKHNFPNTETLTIDLTETYDTLIKLLPKSDCCEVNDLAHANSRSRLRMTTLYHLAGLNGALVVGTGNKIEDFGIGFFTKHGDGGVDINPIAGLTKTEVFELSAYLGVCQSILDAKPTDGLFGDDRSDEQQIGASYPELEWAMELFEKGAKVSDFEGRQREIFEIFVRRNRANQHKIQPIPTCIIPDEWK